MNLHRETKHGISNCPRCANIKAPSNFYKPIKKSI